MWSYRPRRKLIQNTSVALSTAYRPRDECSIISVSGVPVTAVEYPYGLIIFGGKTPKEPNEADFIINLFDVRQELFE